MALLSKTIYMFNTISMTFITETEKPILMFIWKHKRTRITEAILTKKQ
jgi:hypothetical protein